MIKVLRHPLKYVYIDLLTRLISNLYIFSLISISLDKHEFGLYSFSIVLSSLVVTIVNSSTDSLINKDLVNQGLNYKNFLLYKFFLAMFFSFIISFLFNNNIYVILNSLAIIPLVISEHFEIKLRYNNDYYNFTYKLLIQIVFLLLKMYFVYRLSIKGVIISSLLEVIVYVFLNYIFVSKYKPREDNKPISFIIFFMREKNTIMKFTIGSLLIFTFFKIDQIFSYISFGSGVYANYAMACKFNEITNNMVGIWTRYTIPEVFKNTTPRVMRAVMVKNFIAHLFFFSAVSLAAFIFTIYINPIYKSSILIYFILALGGFFLLFGQIRGVFFLKKNRMSSDIINAILGIFSFFVSIYFFKIWYSISIAVSMAYLVGFFMSGFLTTLIYKTGRVFLKKLIFG